MSERKEKQTKMWSGTGSGLCSAQNPLVLISFTSSIPTNRWPLLLTQMMCTASTLFFPVGTPLVNYLKVEMLTKGPGHLNLPGTYRCSALIFSVLGYHPTPCFHAISFHTQCSPQPFHLCSHWSSFVAQAKSTTPSLKNNYYPSLPLPLLLLKHSFSQDVSRVSLRYCQGES